jgi:hypothetical protein
MGYNPFRQRVKRTSDIWIVLGTIAVVAALVLWAVRG